MHESTTQSYSPQESLSARQELLEEFLRYPATPEETERSIGLFLRGALLARILAIDEIYRQIVRIPGSIIDLGTWRGQTAAICENLRAIHEPLNFERRIVCFDTFTGYQGFSPTQDKQNQSQKEGRYAVGGENYAELLRRLLMLHEKCNAMGHNHGKHRVVTGDCRSTVPSFFKENPHEFLALAFFDLNAYEPTAKTIEIVWQKIVPGGIIAFWQLGKAAVPAEGRVYAENFLGQIPHTLSKTSTYPGLCYLVRK